MLHLYGNNCTYFISFRLADSLPQSKIIELKNEYDLKCYSIMPNHVHLLLSALGNTPKGKSDPVNIWLKYIKGSSARLINQKLNTNGILWASESWDKLIRNEFHYHNSFYYTVNNPIKANLGAKYTKMPFMWRCDRDEFY